MKAKALYIHIPFCAHICSYCDFKRILNIDKDFVKKYIHNLMHEIKKRCKFYKFNTIYIGGGTPNCLNDLLLNDLLNLLKKYQSKNCEFTIECNPELLTENQVLIFKQNNINRVSLGAQSLNNNILKDMRRNHTKQDVINSILLLRKYNIDNISLDFIYNYPKQTLSDLKECIDFVKNYQIKHVSYYALEIKDNALLKQWKTDLNLDNEELHLIYLKAMFKKAKYQRYEISNWCLNKSYMGQHNLVYWNYQPWKAIGYGASGYEHRISYEYKDWNIKKIDKIKLTKKDIEINKLIMGLRLFNGFDLNKNIKIFNKYKNHLKNYYIDHRHKLRPNNYDCLNDTIIDLIEG